jgi:flagellin-like protein
MRRLHHDQGVSVIIGTLLLILITVTAAAALGLMISQMQKTEMNRQTQIQAVKDEQIAISGVSLSNNQNLWNSTPYPHNISGSQNWSMISFNLMNLNTQNASVIGISVSSSPSDVNYLYPLNFSSLSGASQGYCNLTSGGSGCQDLNGNLLSPAYLTIPAGGSIKVTMNLTGSLTGDGYANQFIGTDQQIDIKVLTSLTNIFEQTYRLPTPVIVYSTATTNLGNNLQQDSIGLDGSQSSAYNATIVGWNWTIMDANGTVPVGNCLDVNNLTLDNGIQPFYTNKIVRLSPPTDGPFCANVTVTDSNGMVATTSQDQFIPYDAQFNPTANLIATFNPSLASINVTVLNVNGKPVSNADISYILDSNQFGTLRLSSYIGMTDNSGSNSTIVSFGNGTVKVISGQLSPIVVPVANSTSY